MKQLSLFSSQDKKTQVNQALTDRDKMLNALVEAREHGCIVSLSQAIYNNTEMKVSDKIDLTIPF